MISAPEHITSEIISEISDIYAVLNLFKDVLPSLNKGENISIQIAAKLSKYANVLVFRNSGQIVGFVAFYANDDIKHTAYISFISTLPIFQRKGYGSVMLKKVESMSKELGMTLLKLEVNKNNISAQMFYQKHGMVYDGEASSESIYMVKKL